LLCSAIPIAIGSAIFACYALPAFHDLHLKFSKCFDRFQNLFRYHFAFGVQIYCVFSYLQIIYRYFLHQIT
jgi:hypothetical protein